MNDILELSWEIFYPLLWNYIIRIELYFRTSKEEFERLSNNEIGKLDFFNLEAICSLDTFKLKFLGISFM